MSAEEDIEQFVLKFKELSPYDRILKAKQQFPEFTNKQLAEDVIGCPVKKLKKHIAKARLVNDLPQVNDGQACSTGAMVPAMGPSGDCNEDKSVKQSIEEFFQKICGENASLVNTSARYKISNHYRIGAKDSVFADSACDLSIGDKVIINDKGKKSHAIAECFDIKNNKWKVRFQSNFEAALVSIADVQLFETRDQKPPPQIISNSGSSVLSVERITDYRKGKKLEKPISEIIKRPSRLNSLPLLYPTKPAWTDSEAKQLLPNIGMNISSMFGMFTHQRESDAKWKDLSYVIKVLECNMLESEKSKKFNRKSLKQWNLALDKAGYKQVRICRPHTEDSKLSFPEFMEAFGYPSINEVRRNKSQIGLSFDFVPQVCDYCGHHATSLPVCECGESYCGPACRLAEWKNHKDICEQAMDNMMMVSTIDKQWLLKNGYKTDCEGMRIAINNN